MSYAHIHGSGGLSNRKLRQADAVADNVVEGKTFYAGDKALKTGTLPEYPNQNVPANIWLTTNYVNFYIPRGAYTFNGSIYTYVPNADLADKLSITPASLIAGKTILGVTGSSWVPVVIIMSLASTCGPASYTDTRYTRVSYGYGNISGGAGTDSVVFTVTKAGKYRVSGAGVIGDNENGVKFDDGEDRNNMGSTSLSASYVGRGSISLSVGSTITVTAKAFPSAYDCVNAGSVSSRAILISYVGT